MKRQHILSKIIVFFMICLLMAGPFSVVSKAAPAADKVIRIVLDPGHGGDSFGGEYFGYKEKDLNLQLALAMQKKLKKFENVKAYCTRKEDVDLSFAKRCAYATGKNADILISLHFNESENHNQTGTEIYVSSTAKLRKPIMPVAQALSDAMEMYAGHSEGIFTCVAEDNEDYFGLLRQASRDQLSVLIIEEMYMDRKEFVPYFETEDAIDKLADRNVSAIAKAYKLYSEELGIDYRDFTGVKYSEPQALKENYAHPVSAEIEISDYTQTSLKTAEVKVKINATAGDKLLSHYRYSTDGGKNFSGKVKWNEDGDNVFSFVANEKEPPVVRVLVYNVEGLSVTGNDINVFSEIKLDPEYDAEPEKTVESPENEADENTSEAEQAEEFKGVYENEVRLTGAKTIVIAIGAMAGLAICLLLFVSSRKEKKKK